MATTTNFGWETPDDTDLVKDGAAAIRTALGGVDTSFVDLKGGTTGQVLSKASNTDLDYTWVTTDDANAIQNAIVDAKGDLIAASAADTPARLAVGNNGETLVANSSTSTGLAWSPQYTAGKNKVLNADFNINQRAFTSTTTEFVYGVDRFFMRATGGTNTYSVQTFTPGDAPIAQYEGKNYVRLVSSGQSGTGDRTILRTYIESARTLANQTVTISFWAKAASGTPNICPSIFISYGTGGSPSANIDWGLTTKKTISTSWVRYSFTGTMPSLSGKTFGTNNNDYIALDIAVSAGSTLAQFDGIGLQSNTFDIWGLQLEAGSSATSFQTATGTIQGELAACQRYFQRFGNSVTNEMVGLGVVNSNTGYVQVQHNVTLRTTPALTFSAAGDFVISNGVSSPTSTFIGADVLGTKVSSISAAFGVVVVAGTAARLYRNGSASGAYIDFSAEL